MNKIFATLMIAAMLSSGCALAREKSDAVIDDCRQESSSSVNRNEACPAFEDKTSYGPRV
jgi:hypothetical protein